MIQYCKYIAVLSSRVTIIHQKIGGSRELLKPKEKALRFKGSADKIGANLGQYVVKDAKR